MHEKAPVEDTCSFSFLSEPVPQTVSTTRAGDLFGAGLIMALEIWRGERSEIRYTKA
jgi:hypothetical protein